MSVPNLAWCAIAGLIGLLWGLSEIIGAFKNEIGYALRTGGAWMLILLNAGAAAAIFFVTASLVPEANNWLTAIFIGLAWPTVVRNLSFKLAQPIQSDQADASAAIRFEQAYATVQELARQLINAALTRQRMQLVTTATEHDLDDLERFARMALIASPLQTAQGMPAEQFIDEILKRDSENRIKKAYLSAFILASFGRNTLDDFLKEQRTKKAEKSRERPPQTA